MEIDKMGNELQRAQRKYVVAIYIYILFGECVCV